MLPCQNKGGSNNFITVNNKLRRLIKSTETYDWVIYEMTLSVIQEGEDPVGLKIESSTLFSLDLQRV